MYKHAHILVYILVLQISMAAAFYLGQDAEAPVHLLLNLHAIKNSSTQYEFASMVHAALVGGDIISKHDTSVLFTPDSDRKYAAIVVQNAPVVDERFTAARLEAIVLEITGREDSPGERTISMVASFEDPERIDVRIQIVSVQEINDHLASLTLNEFSLDGVCRIRSKITTVK